jgi:hypothetical protein
MTAAPKQLMRQAIRLAHAQFDMRCAEATAQQLEDHHDDIGALAYGLLTGMTVAYARPFTSSYAYGRLEAKWAKFPSRPDLLAHHEQLLERRNTLLAHNDLSPHRATVVWTRGAFHADRPVVLEARSPINAAGITEARKLFNYQRERFTERLEHLINELQQILEWPPAEIELERELDRLGN